MHTTQKYGKKSKFQEGYFDRLECKCQGEFYAAGPILGNRYLCTNLSIVASDCGIRMNKIIYPASEESQNTCKDQRSPKG